MEEGFAIWANPSSPHAEGRRARAALEEAREACKAALGWQGELIFTSGASEALAIGLGRTRAGQRIASAVEHDAVFRAAPDAAILAVGSEGAPDVAQMERLIAKGGPAVVAMQAVNSETGTLVLDERAELPPGSMLLVDCSQSAGKRALPPCDMAVVAAHKFGGPIGVGALLVRDFAMLEPVGGHERGYRAGTENLPGALGMAAALQAGDWATSAEDRAAFADRLGDSVLRVGQQVDYILPLTHPQMSAQALLIRLDAMGFAVSAGSACSSGSLKPSRVLTAFGLDADRARRTIRVSLGWNTTRQDLDAFAHAWASL